jgi:hypothetical protein
MSSWMQHAHFLGQLGGVIIIGYMLVGLAWLIQKKPAWSKSQWFTASMVVGLIAQALTTLVLSSK